MSMSDQLSADQRFTQLYGSFCPADGPHDQFRGVECRRIECRQCFREVESAAEQAAADQREREVRAEYEESPQLDYSDMNRASTSPELYRTAKALKLQTAVIEAAEVLRDWLGQHPSFASMLPSVGIDVIVRVDALRAALEKGK